MTPAQVIPIIEGLLGTVGTESTQVVETWVAAVKHMLRSETYRYLDDLQFDIVPSITDVGIPVSASATHLIADVWEISGDLGTDTSAFCGYSDADTDTIDITVALSTQEDVVTLFSVADLVTTGVSQYYPHIYLAGSAGPEATEATYARTGIALSVGLTAWADGKDGNAATAASVRAFCLYRT